MEEINKSGTVLSTAAKSDLALPEETCSTRHCSVRSFQGERLGHCLNRLALLKLSKGLPCAVDLSHLGLIGLQTLRSRVVSLLSSQVDRAATVFLCDCSR